MGSAVAHNSTAQIRFHQEIATQEDAKTHLNRSSDSPGVHERRPGGSSCICKCIRRKRGGRRRHKQIGHEHSSLRATSHQPTGDGGDKNKKGADGTAARRDTNSNGSRNATTVKNYPRGSKFPNCILENKGCKYSKSKGGPSQGYKPTKGGNQQHQHSYQKGVLDITYLCCSNSHE